MLTNKQLQFVSKLPEPMLTAYVRTRADDASKHVPVPPYLTWLKKEANSIVGSVPSNECSLFREQLRRVEEFLHDRTSREQSLVILAGPKTWEMVSLQVEVGNELRWGKPALSQLLWLLAENRPYCIVAVDHSGANFFGYRLREMSQLRETKFDVDISQWKKKDRAHVSRPGIRETYGSQRDVFEHRIDAQYKRLCRQTAERVIRLCREKDFSAVFLVGLHSLIGLIAAQFPAELRRRVVLVQKDLGKLEPDKLREHLEPEIQKWERRHELSLVNRLLDSERGVVIGIDETLAQLQKERIRTLVLCRDLDARLHRCTNCGWIDSSADPVCCVCRGNRSVVALRDVLPELTDASEADVQVVSNDAATKLKEAGGIGAWLRHSKQRAVSRDVAQAEEMVPSY